MPGRILLVEDDESVRQEFSRALRKRAIEIDELTDGEIAVEAIRSGRYDLVVLDLRLPKKDGFEILRAVRDEFPKPVVLALSASREDVERVAGDRSVMACINKAFALSNLDPVIAAIAAVTNAQ